MAAAPLSDAAVPARVSDPRPGLGGGRAACGRAVYRLGQYRPIKVVRIIIENSIESRILQLQEKKNLLFQSTVGMDSSALSRLTEEDLRFLFIL